MGTARDDFLSKFMSGFPARRQCSSTAITSRCTAVAEYVIENDTSTPPVFCYACLPEAIRRRTLREPVLVRRLER